jgi:transposase
VGIESLFRISLYVETFYLYPPRPFASSSHRPFFLPYSPSRVAWLSQNRRTSRDYERLCASGEAFIYVAMSRLMVRRLARS